MIDVRKHLEAHYLRSKTTGETKEFVDGLWDVAISVLHDSGIDYYKTGLVVTKKPRYFPKPKSEAKKNTRISKSKKKTSKTVRKEKKSLKKRRATRPGGNTTKMIGPISRAKSSDWKTVK